MRYLNWDALLFPKASKAPLQEFRTSCHAVQDQEPFNSQMHLLPTVTSFVPGLKAGEPFRLSIHCWETPEPTTYCQSFVKHGDRILFEARIFIDGIHTSSNCFPKTGPWPAIIDDTHNLSKTGDRELLRFPPFHQEVLARNYWSAGDELGRIKVIITEVIFRDHISTTLPFERVRNVVAFSFQHAPLELLEGSSIAWPNTAMFHQVACPYPWYALHSSPRRIRDISGSVIHTHSPRTLSNDTGHEAFNSMSGSSFASSTPIFQRPGHVASFNEQASYHSRYTSSDISMPDYTSSASGGAQSRRITDPQGLLRLESMPESLRSNEIYERIGEVGLPVPMNTPQHPVSNSSGNAHLKDSVSPLPKGKRERDHETSPTPANTLCSLGNARTSPTPPSALYPSGNIKSRKENMHKSPSLLENSSKRSDSTRKVAQSLSDSKNANRKRQRTETPPMIEDRKSRDHSASRISSQETVLHELGVARKDTC